MFFTPSISRERANIWSMVFSNTNDYTKIKIKMPNPSQEHPGSFKAKNQDLEDMDALFTFKFKMETQNLEYG